MSEMPGMPSPAEPPPRACQGSPGLLVPLAIIVAALTVWTGFQTTQLVSERRALHTVVANQEPTIQEAQKLRAQLDSIAGKTALLAAQGNAGAKTIVEELRKRGVTISRPVTPAPAK